MRPSVLKWWTLAEFMPGYSMQKLQKWQWRVEKKGRDGHTWLSIYIPVPCHPTLTSSTMWREVIARHTHTYTRADQQRWWPGHNETTVLYSYTNGCASCGMAWSNLPTRIHALFDISTVPPHMTTVHNGNGNRVFHCRCCCCCWWDRIFATFFDYKLNFSYLSAHVSRIQPRGTHNTSTRAEKKFT